MTRIAFIGAGSVVFTRQLVADLLRFPELGDADIALHDIDEQRLAVAAGLGAQTKAALGAHARFSATTDRRQALAGADFVINMIQVGGIDGTRTDLEVPARFGLRQTIGDTTGVGGVFRALRTFPVLSAILADMVEVCPNALLLNYTNPMAMNVWWASVAAPAIQTYGLCHSVYWTFHGLSELIGVPTEGAHHRAAGVNHQAWLLEWSRDGQDLYPLLRERIAADPELERRVRVEVFKRIGYYPTETSEHSAEYLPWFLRSQEQIERYRLEPLVYLQISEDNVAEFLDAQAALAEGRSLPVPTGAVEYAPQVIHSIVAGQPREIHVNVANRGLIDNLPQGAAVEVPATLDGNGVTPIAMGALPVQCAAMNRPYLSVAELTVEAMRTQSPELIRQAVLMDPNANSTLTPEGIWELCNAMVEAHGALLPEPLRVSLPARGL
jgi:alpha-galactosidase